MNTLTIRDPSDGSIIERPNENLAAASFGRAIEPEKAIQELDDLLLGVSELPHIAELQTLQFYPHLRKQIVDAGPKAKHLKLTLAPDIGRLGRRLVEVVKAPADNKANRALICMMLDTLPSAKNFEGRNYTDYVVWALKTEVRENNVKGQPPGFGPTLVACCIRDIIRTATFTPTPAVVLDGTHAQSSRFLRAAWKARHMLERINWVINQFDDSK